MKKNLSKKAFGLIACVAMVISSLSFPITAQAVDLPPAPPPDEPNVLFESGSSAPTSTQEEDPYAYLKPLENMIDDALAELKTTGKAPTIYYAPEDEKVCALPNYIMQMLVKNPELSLEFSYKWKNVNYTIYIGPGQAIDDDEAWYGPENLYGVYMNAINPAAQIFSVSTASMQNTASNVAVSNSFNTLYGQASDAPRTSTLGLSAKPLTLVDPDVNILITQNISPRRDLTVVENGSLQVLSWSNLPKNPAGPVYAVVDNQYDGTYALGGYLNANGTATFSGFKLRPASTITICK